MGVRDIVSLSTTLDLTHRLAHQARRNGSPLVRKELARLFHRVLTSGSAWTSYTIWVYLLQRAALQMSSEEDECMALMAQVGSKTSLEPEQHRHMLRLCELVKVLHLLCRDPTPRVRKLVCDALSALAVDLRMRMEEGMWDRIVEADCPGASVGNGWTVELMEAVKKAGIAFLEDWDQLMNVDPVEVRDVPSKELFERSKMSLQEYLAVSESRIVVCLAHRCVERGSGSVASQQNTGQAEYSAERKRVLRHRILEDSLVLADQQGASLSGVLTISIAS